MTDEHVSLAGWICRGQAVGDGHASLPTPTPVLIDDRYAGFTVDRAAARTGMAETTEATGTFFLVRTTTGSAIAAALDKPVAGAAVTSLAVSSPGD